ncbi:MAG: VWA domain-containing protein [Clostridia bacterium]|nr:VWA domain-containing protein [Clostridia bacterium]
MEKEIVKENQVECNEGITELVFILDKSGSMSGMERDTIGGFNAMIEKQKEIPGKVYVSTVLFSNTSQVLHDRKTLEEIAPLTEKDYRVGGCTALLDAVGGAIKHIGNIHKYARKEDVPTRTMFIITTDGMENASREYHNKQIKDMIRKQEEKYGWEFLFLAANLDAAFVADSIGIKKDCAVNYVVEEETAEMFEEVGEVLCQARKDIGVRMSCYAPMIEENIKKRKNKSK